MYGHYLKVLFRNLVRGDTVTFINIIGLSVGLACSIITMLWIRNELTCASFHKNYNAIYRLQLSTFREGNLTENSPITSVPMSPSMRDNFPEIKSYVRLRQIANLLFQYEDNYFREDIILAADSNFFDIFSFDLIQGIPKTALSGPYKIVLTETLAHKIFSDESAMGNPVLINGDEHFIVSGVVRDPPQNSHIKYNGLISMSTLWADNPCTSWNCNYSFYTYFLLNNGADPDSLEEKFPDFQWEPLNKKKAQVGWREEAYLLPFGDIHFNATSPYQMETPGNIGMVYLFSAIALLILVIACINFINLSTAQSTKKGKEIGIKKVADASRRQLALQHIGVVFMQAFIALMISMILVELILPAFNNFLHMQLIVDYGSVAFLVGTLLLLAGITFGSGSYSAFYFTSMNPANILKAKISTSPQPSRLRNSLFVIQFTISITLIASTLIIYGQLNFLLHHDIGFDKENILNMPLSNEDARDQWEQLKIEMNKLPEVASVGASTLLPGGATTSNGYKPEGFDSPRMLKVLDIDEDFFGAMGITVIDGRDFSNGIASDKHALIINEQLARKLNWENPVGKVIGRKYQKHEVIGLVRDFNFTSLHHEMEPLIITQNPWEGVQSYGYLSGKLSSDNFAAILQKLEYIWNEQINSIPFEFSFPEDRLNAQYQNEQRLSKAFVYFSFLAIFISCLGLYGVILFLTEQKTKEIGIRKSLGGSVKHILLLLSRDLTKWIVLALFLSIPFAWYFMNKWRMNFAYAVKIDWWIFIMAGMITIFFFWFTISWHTARATLKMPVETLRYA